MAQQDRFKQAIIQKIAQRAANHCSNPTCNAITSGPSAEPEASVNVGEAAHIYGANPGSARYDPEMQPSERSAISNAIWLCGNCHKLVDNDPVRYPAGLLFEWQREHEHNIADLVGKAGAEIRRRYEDRHLEELGRLSYLAQRIVLEKDSWWEYQLTAEVLRFEMAPILKRWSALKRQLYLKPYIQISRGEFSPWLIAKGEEIQALAKAWSELVNNEFTRAWGAPSVPGDDADIIEISRLYGEICKSALAWEESVRFTSVDAIFLEVRDLYIGVAGSMIDEATKLPAFIADLVEKEPSSGSFHLQMTLDVPKGWGDAVSRALEQAKYQIIQEAG
jgi:hypothetical protein